MGRRGGGSGHNQGPGNKESCPGGNTSGGRQRRSHPVLSSSAPGKMFIPTNPFANPSALQVLKEFFANWKAAVVEGETWEGTSADENAAKWRKLNHIDE